MEATPIQCENRVDRLHESDLHGQLPQRDMLSRSVHDQNANRLLEVSLEIVQFP